MEMGTIERLRHEALESRYQDLQNCTYARKRKLQELYAVSRHIERSKPFPNDSIVAHWGSPEDVSLEEPERKFLEANDIQKNFYFNEASLPTYGHSHPPQTTGPTKSTFVPPPAVQSKSTAATPTSTRASSPLQPLPLAKLPQALAEPPVEQEAELLAAKKSPPGHDAPSPSPQEEVKVNGHADDHDSPILEKPAVAHSPEKEVTTVPPTPSPPSSPRPQETREETTPAPVLNINNVPVIQETSTSIPDEREKAFGVHPPPPPPELDRDTDMADDAPAAASPSPALSPPPQSPPSPTKRTQVDPDKEIPDSQGSPAKAESETPAFTESIEEARLPAVSSQIQQLPIHPPLLVNTDPEQKPRTVPPQKPVGEEQIQPEVSSPASSVDLGEGRSTPGALPISSATSPDRQFATPEQSKAVVETNLQEDSVELGRAQEIAEDNGEALLEKPVLPEKTEKEDLPSTAVAPEVVDKERDLDVQLPTIPPEELPTEEALQEEEEIREKDLPRPAEAQPEESTSILSTDTSDKIPIPQEHEEVPSPDPSAQLRLETLLANGVARPTSPAKTNEQAEQPERPQTPQLRNISKGHVAAPSPSPPRKSTLPPPPLPAASKREPVLDEEEDEDRVQLVGSHEPTSRMPSPTSAKNIPDPEPEKVERSPEPAATTLKEERAAPEAQPEEPIPQREPETSELDQASLHEDTLPEAPEREESASEDKVEPQVEPEIGKPSAGAEHEGVDNEVLEKVPEEEPAVPAPDRMPTPTPSAEQDVVMGEAEPEPELESVDRAKAQELPVREETRAVNGLAEEEQIETLAAGLDVSGKPSSSAEVGEEIVGKAPAPESISTQAEAPVSEKIIEDTTIPDITSPAATQEELPTTSGPMQPQDQAERQTTPVVDSQVEPVPEESEERATEAITEGNDVLELSAPTSAALSTPSTRPKKHKHRPARLSKVVISSAHHAAIAAEAEARRLRMDKEQQGMVVAARREAQQAASAATKGRSSLFQSGTKFDHLTRFNIGDQTPKDKKVELFDVLYTAKSYPISTSALIERSTKTLTTDNLLMQNFESQAVRVLTRIQELQDQGLWSLRQLARAPEPKRKMAHWDYLIEEAKWLREDFREERKWKLAVAHQVANWVMEWHNATPGRRARLLIDRKRVGKVPKGLREERKKNEDVDMSDISQPTPDLIASGGTPEEEGSEDYFVKQEGGDDDVAMRFADGDDMFDHLKYPPPAAVFALGPESTIFNMFPTKAADDALAQLPLYAPPKPPVSNIRLPDANESWLLPITPVTKFATAQITSTDEEGPPRKRSRYEYEPNPEPYADDSDEEGYVITGEGIPGDGLDTYGRPKSRDKDVRPTPLPAEQTNVALFRPEFKPTLQRIRSHTFRPPADMPPTAFFECRSPSLWTAAEDEQLKLLAKEYHHNWGLVSTFMSLDGMWHSGSERRSPWECFERWLSLEQIPQEFTKTPFYKHVQHRLEAAQRMGGQYGSASQSSAGNSQSQSGNVVKRRGTAPLRVEKRRTTRCMNVFESMRKLAKKRETSISKSQQSGRAAQMAAMRKQQESQGNNANSQMRTPAYFSLMKFEKERQLNDQKQMVQQLQQQQNAQRVAQAQAQAGQQNRMHPGTHLSNGTTLPSQQPRLGTPTTQGSPVVANSLPNGAGAAKSPSIPHPVPTQVTAGMRPQIATANVRQMSPAEIAQLQRLRQAQALQQSQAFPNAAPQHVQQMQQQLMAQQATQAALGSNGGHANIVAPLVKAGMNKIPSQQEMSTILRQHNPRMSTAEADIVAREQIARYHASLSNSIAQQNPALRQQQSSQQQQQQQQQQQRQNSNSGILMSATGPVGPGSSSLQSSRSATPQQPNGVSPRIPQQQHQPQQQPPTAPMAGQQQPPPPPPSQPLQQLQQQPQPQSQPQPQ